VENSSRDEREIKEKENLVLRGENDFKEIIPKIYKANCMV